MSRSIKYKTISQNAKFNKSELLILRHLSRRCMTVYKKSLRNIKDNYENNNTYLSKYDNWDIIQNDDYFFDVNTEIKQRACFMSDSAYQSYFELLKYQKKNNLEITAKAPDYPKSKYANISFSYLGNKYDKNGNRYFVVPLSVPYKSILRSDSEEYDKLSKLGINPLLFGFSESPFIKITIPRVLRNTKIQEVSLIPICGAKRFKIQYKYVDTNTYVSAKGDETLSIDLGVNNLMTCVTTKGNSFIVDGKRLKSMNQYFNKRLSELRRNNPYVLTPYQDYLGRTLYRRTLRKNLKYKESFKYYITKRISRLYLKRDNKISDYIYKACNLIIDYCLDNNISKLVLGYNKDFQIGGFKYPDNYNELNNMNKHYIKQTIKENNQKFFSIPFGKIRNRLTYLCSLHNIEMIITEESYTSLASFYDNDDLPVYDKDNKNTYTFSGKREKRGMYITRKGNIINADINGALNILKKSSVCDIKEIEYLRHIGVSTPIRLRVI